MQAPFDNIVQHLFHQPSLQSVTVDELERMAQAHPYFAAAHFLLLKKMQQTDHPQFTSQLHKTTLYFNNPLWLQFLLQPETVQGFTVLDKSPFIAEESAPAEIQQEHNVYIQEAPAPPPAIHESIEAGLPEVITAESDPRPAASGPNASEPAPAGIMDVITEVFQEDEATETASSEEKSLQVDEQSVPVAQVWDNAAASDRPEDPLEETAIPHETWLPDTLVTVVNEQAGHSDTAFENEIATPEEIPVPIVVPAEDHEQPFGQETAAVAENAEEADATDAPVAEQVTPDTPLLKSVIDTQSASSDTLFEPYHTVDYFASQGIKLSKLETDAKDKLGRQLKSFTEWLKTMKRLPQVSIDKILSENEESKVVADAIHSIENKEVITEAMAEVFEKQGMNEKAVEVYQKLSLLNPAKSTYFAAKIAILKH